MSKQRSQKRLPSVSPDQSLDDEDDDKSEHLIKQKLNVH